jgi:hypothetical protein
VIKPEVFAVLDAMNTLTGRRAAVPHRHARSGCPCPKCKTDARAARNQDAGVYSR